MNPKKMRVLMRKTTLSREKNDGKVFPFFVFIGIYYKKTYAS